jgi:hypothetical protein
LTATDSFHIAAYQVEYETVLARAQYTVAGFPPLLQNLAGPLLPGWGVAPFSRIVALLPYWVAGLLDRAPSPDGKSQPSRRDETETLAQANLLGWWSILIQDGLLDRGPDKLDLLPLSMALHAAAVRLLAGLLPGCDPFWQAFEQLSLASSEACAWERRRRLDGLGAVGLDPTDPDRLAERSSLLQLAVAAQCALRGIGPDHPLCAALCDMLRHYAIARQIADDRSDWVQDLQHGQLNHVSSRLTRRMLDGGAIGSFAELDLERMMGYYLHDDELFAAIQREAVDACRRAAQCIAPYRSRPLDSLVGELAEQLEQNYRTALDSRRRLRAAFALGKQR